MKRQSFSHPVPASCLVILVLFAACNSEAPPSTETALETEDVSLPPDVLVDTHLDVREERAPVDSLSGRLPSDFPKDFPVFSGASLVDFGSESDRWIEFLIPRSSTLLAKEYLPQLHSAGWTPIPPNSSSLEEGIPLTLEANDVRVEVTLRKDGPSTRVIVRY